MLGSFAISTATGFGAAVMAIPVCSFFVDVKMVVPLLALCSVLTCIYMTFHEHSAVDWDELRRMLAWGSLGFPVGNLGFHYLPISILKLLLGLFITGVAGHGLWRLYRRRPRVPWNRHAGRAILVLGGMIQGALASGGPLIVTYAHNAMPDRRRFRATLFVFWIILNSVFVGSYFAGPDGNPAVLLLALCAIPPLAAGTWLGQKLHHAASDQFFQVLVSGVLLVSGLSLLMR